MLLVNREIGGWVGIGVYGSCSHPGYTGYTLLNVGEQGNLFVSLLRLPF